jgi:hypothetical protein
VRKEEYRPSFVRGTAPIEVKRINLKGEQESKKERENMRQ